MGENHHLERFNSFLWLFARRSRASSTSAGLKPRLEMFFSDLSVLFYAGENKSLMSVDKSPSP
jgi:hypothetical protein